jgi:hypothetical protein
MKTLRGIALALSLAFGGVTAGQIATSGDAAYTGLHAAHKGRRGKISASPLRGALNATDAYGRAAAWPRSRASEESIRRW